MRNVLAVVGVMSTILLAVLMVVYIWACSQTWG